MLRVNEVFETIQGEARFTGTPSVFIRLQGCPVGCSWCDTKHTWPDGAASKRISVDAMLSKTTDAATWCDVSTEELVGRVSAYRARHFVITGGEPCAQNIEPLTAMLAEVGTVQVETSGTYPIVVSPLTWVTVSPKVGMRGGRSVLDAALERADEIKMPIASTTDIANLVPLARDRDPRTVWLQPVSQGDDATRLCVEACMANGWRLSIQTHKYAGVR